MTEAARVRAPDHNYSRTTQEPRTAGPGTPDPARKERILGAAADLVASSGYHAWSMQHRRRGPIARLRDLPALRR